MADHNKMEPLEDFVKWQPPVTRDLIEKQILVAGSNMLLSGPPKSWKSMLANYTIARLSTGRPWLGYKTRKCVVYHLQAELRRHIYHKRTIKYRANDPDFAELSKGYVYVRNDRFLKIDSSYGIAALEKDLSAIRQIHPKADLLMVIDPLFKVMSGRITDEYDVRHFLDNVDILSDRYNTTSIIVHHGKRTFRDPTGKIVDLGRGEDTLGSIYLPAWCDTLVRLKPTNPMSGNNKVKLYFDISRHDESILPAIKIAWDKETLQPAEIHKYYPKGEIEEELEDESESVSGDVLDSISDIHRYK